MGALDEFESKIVADIDEYGWSRMGVFPRPDRPEDGPVFAYSIGFTATLNMPEVIIFGLRIEVMHSMLWNIFDELKTGQKLTDGARWETILPGYQCETRQVHPSHIVLDYFNSAIWHWNTYLGHSKPLEAFQLFWPGVEDRLLPWDEGTDQSVIDAQPRLDLPVQDA